MLGILPCLDAFGELGAGSLNDLFRTRDLFGYKIMEESHTFKVCMNQVFQRMIDLQHHLSNA